MVFLRFPFQCGVQCVPFDCGMVVSSKIRHHIASVLGSSDFSLVYNGKTLLQDESVPQDANIIVTFSLPGGKGGFGSMLRAIGAQIEKTTNREACRDLSGRRLRDINEEQRLKKWISKESEREAEKMQRRKARIERLKSKPKHNFNDFEYEKKLSEWPERVEEAVTAAMEKKKRPAPESEAAGSAVQKKKKKHLWLDDDLSYSSGSDLDNSNSCSQEDANFNSIDKTDSEKAGCSTMPDDQDASLHSLGETSSSSHCSNENQPSEVDSVSSQQHSTIDASDKDVVNSEKADQPPSPAKSTCTLEKLKENVLSDMTPSENKAVNEVDATPVDLLSFESASQLESLGLDRLKTALMERGLKCGGTLTDRAQRLFQVRGLQPHQYPPSLLAKKKK